MSKNPTRIVVLDDEPTTSRIAAKYIRDEFVDRVEVTATSDISEARRLINENRCDVLVSDIEMPGATGLDMLQFTRRSNSWTRVILMTGHSTWDRIAEAVEYGASDYLIKPLDRDQLIQVVAHECDRLKRWQGAIKSTLLAPPE